MRNLLIKSMVFIALLGPALKSNAQSGNINDELRSILKGIKIPGADSVDREPFFWEMSAHSLESQVYTYIHSDTGSTYSWETLYFEMFLSAYDSTLLPQPIPLVNSAEAHVHNDTVPIGIMDFGYNMLNSSAFDINGTLLNWDNYTVSLVPGMEPFDYDSALGNYRWMVFDAAPFEQYSQFRNVTFSIDPSFIFYGSSVNLDPIDPSQDSVQIDFGDGSGWHYVDITHFQTVAITYPYAGTFYVQVKVTHDGTTIRYSSSTFEVQQNQLTQNPDYSITNISGINVGVYLGCGHDSVVKPVIYLEGIDPLETRHVPEIYTEMINDPYMIMLRNYGYDFVVVDWKNSRIDMRDNAASVQALLEYLMTKVQDTTQFIVIGESMGGVIGRWALTYMETSGYINGGGGSPPHPKSHNTRLFITIDAPQQGAVIPMSAQALVYKYYGWTPSLWKTAWAVADVHRKATYWYEDVLEQTAVEELLIYNQLGRDPSTGTYSDLAARTSFWGDLLAMNETSGGYPVHCKKVALSNGLMDGKNQVGIGNSIVAAGDKYLDMTTHLNVNVLNLYWYLYLDIDRCKLYAAPNGTGTILNMQYTFYDPGIIGCIIDFVAGIPGCITPYSETDSLVATDVKPLETMAGGYYPALGTYVASPYALYTNIGTTLPQWLGNFFLSAFTLDSTTGTVTYNSNLEALDPSAFGFSANMKIVNFCFIPYTSSLDYQNPAYNGDVLPLNYDILNSPASFNISNTPYDVIVGWVPDTVDFISYPNLTALNTQNYQHLAERNDFVSGYTDATWLNREIGDFDMYLDNLWINRPATFQATRTIRAGNEENPFYAYPDRNIITPLSGGSGLFSNNKNFIVDSVGGDVVFKAGQEIRLEPGFEARHGSQFRAEIVPEDTCNYTYAELQYPEKRNTLFGSTSGNIAHQNGGTVNSSPGLVQQAFAVWPNPSDDRFNVSLPPSPQTFATIYDVFGKTIAIFDVSNQNAFVVDAGKYGLANGIYLLVINGQTKTYKEKMVVNH